jgi:hypothetical protein
MENFELKEEFLNIENQKKVLKDDLNNLKFYKRLFLIGKVFLIIIFLIISYNFNNIFDYNNLISHKILYTIIILVLIFYGLSIFYIKLKVKSAEFCYVLSNITFENENKKIF